MKVDKFIFLVDFVILDIEANVEMPLTLGQSFLSISRALIDFNGGRMVLWVGDEELEFKLPKAMRHTLPTMTLVTL